MYDKLKTIYNFIYKEFFSLIYKNSYKNYPFSGITNNYNKL